MRWSDAAAPFINCRSKEERDELSGGEVLRLVRDLCSSGSKVVAGALCSSKVLFNVALSSVSAS